MHFQFTTVFLATLLGTTIAAPANARAADVDNDPQRVNPQQAECLRQGKPVMECLILGHNDKRDGQYQDDGYQGVRIDITAGSTMIPDDKQPVFMSCLRQQHTAQECYEGLQL